MNRSYLDNYEDTYTSYSEMEIGLKDYEEDTQWIPGVISKDVTVEPFVQLESEEISQRLGVYYDTVFDTADRTGLILNYGGKQYLLRDTAIDTVFDTAKINGPALNRLPKAYLAEVLNKCFTVAKGDSLLLFRGQKLCACLSDSVYKIMPISELLKITIAGLEDKFGTLDFIKGENTYSYTSAIWELPEAQEDLLEKYDNYVDVHKNKMHGHTFMPAVKFITSDVGKYAATVIPLFKMSNGAYFHINGGIKVAHKRGSIKGQAVGIEAYKDAIKGIFAKFADIEKTLGAMSKTIINNPVNAAIGMCKKAGVSKKYASLAIDEIETFSQGRPIFMDDIYLSIAAISAEAKNDGMKGSRLLDFEENIAKILTYNWSEFDVSGVVSW